MKKRMKNKKEKVRKNEEKNNKLGMTLELMNEKYERGKTEKGWKLINNEEQRKEIS